MGWSVGSGLASLWLLHSQWIHSTSFTPLCRNVQGSVRLAGRVGASPIALVQRVLIREEHSLQELKLECWCQCEEYLLWSLLDAQYREVLVIWLPQGFSTFTLLHIHPLNHLV